MLILYTRVWGLIVLVISYLNIEGLHMLFIKHWNQSLQWQAGNWEASSYLCRPWGDNSLQHFFFFTNIIICLIFQTSKSRVNHLQPIRERSMGSVVLSRTTAWHCPRAQSTGGHRAVQAEGWRSAGVAWSQSPPVGRVAQTVAPGNQWKPAVSAWLLE